MKHLKLLIVIIIIITLLAGCNRNDQQTTETPTPEQTASGGVSDPAENINVKDIDIVQKDGSTVITISMLSGSRANGYPESKLVELPEYKITLLGSPQRLRIQLDNISFWDYEAKPSWELNNFAAGLFREVPADDDSLILYVQLTQSAVFNVEELNEDLVITLTPSASAEGMQYYCVADAFLEHQDGTWPDSIDMQPVLCSDGINKILISEPFSSENAANDFATQNNIVLESIFDDKKIYVISLQPGTLPNYEINNNIVTLEDYSVVLANDIVINTPPLLENGRFLAAGPNGRIAFSRRYKPEEPSLGQDFYLLSEKVWILEPNGRKTELKMPEFFSVKEAAFSPDGSMLAILDVSIENSVLYVYDFNNEEEPYNLGEEGFGSITDSFAWSDEENVLYAMSGPDSDSVQLLACSFTDEGLDIYAVEEAAGGAGKLAVSNGRVFFADRLASEGGIIYEITDTRQELFEGVDFKISSDNKTMLVLESYSSGEEERTTNLKLCDIETKECKYIASNVNIEDYGFSYNLGSVYYTKAAENPVEDYQYEFVSYDIVTETTSINALVSTADFEVSSQPGQMYFIKEILNDEQNFIATFIYDLKQ